MSAAKLRQRRRSSGHARRPRTPLRRRIGGRLPSAARLLALLIFVGAVAGLVVAINGPWLRITTVAHAGQRYAPVQELDAIMDGYRGASVLSIDSEALQKRLTALPAIAEASVTVSLPGDLRVELSEKAPAFVWRTSAVQLIGAADGTILAELPLDAELDQDLGGLPGVTDARRASRGWTVGDVVNDAEVRVALRLVALDPDLIGSRSRSLTVSVDDQFGFMLASSQPVWRAAMGFYELDPREDR
ncbi:MAG TPA: FtsQ-type POTRA domain-containing protein, partial [Candidatus Limnocylindria bacterium]|nr:FtsQ-type POTRA domain-containing protein [Candidatus Limnocylindria bacterium]